MLPGPGEQPRKHGQQVGPWKLPRYSDLNPVEVRRTELDDLGLASVLELVDRVNAFRADLGLRYVTRSSFPTNPRNWKALSAEFRSHISSSGNKLIQARRVIREIPTRTTRAKYLTHQYSIEEPFIDFIGLNLEFLTARQEYVIDLSLGISCPWQDIDIVANDLRIETYQAQSIFDSAFNVFWGKSGCWRSINNELSSILDKGAISLEEVKKRPWSSGVPNEVLAMVISKLTGTSHANFGEAGTLFFPVKLGRVRAFASWCKSRYCYGDDTPLTASNIYKLYIERRFFE